MESAAVSMLLKWIHLMATVAWIGGMFTNFFVYLPALGKVLDPPTMGKLMGAVMKRFRILVYVSMAIFLITGVLLGMAHVGPDHDLASTGGWISLLFLKVGLFVIMVFLAVYAFEILAPRVAEIASKGPSDDLKRMQKSQMIFAMIGFILGIIILAISSAL